jgi:glutamyl-Q tRNA(Asp) synthetase
MASYLDAKAHQGTWLLRIEDLDFDRNVAGADQQILQSLQRCGMQWDGEVVWQSQRQHLYEAALRQLGDYVYPCACSRKEIADSPRVSAIPPVRFIRAHADMASPREKRRAHGVCVPEPELGIICFEDRLCARKVRTWQRKSAISF